MERRAQMSRASALPTAATQVTARFEPGCAAGPGKLWLETRRYRLKVNPEVNMAKDDDATDDPAADGDHVGYADERGVEHRVGQEND